MSTGNIQQTPPKRSVNIPLLQISVVTGFANQLETHLSRRTFMQTEIVHCSLLLRTSIGGRWDKINCCHVYYVGLVKDASFKTVISEVRVLSKQWRDVQEYHNLCHYHRQGCVWKIFESSFNTAEWIKTTSTLVYYGGLASADWIILEYSGPSSLKAEVTSKGERARRWKDLLKCHWAVGALNFRVNFTEHEAIERRLVAVCFSLLLLINWICIRPKGG